MISCCTMCVHFPDGLSSLLPDLVCVVLHSPVIRVSSRTAFVPLHPFIHITQICAEFVTFGVLCSVSPIAWSCRLVCGRSLCPVRNNLYMFCAQIKSLPVCLSVYPMWAVHTGADSITPLFLGSFRAAPLQQVLRPL